MSYAEFLARKTRRHNGTGIVVQPTDLHPSLHPWQNSPNAQDGSR